MLTEANSNMITSISTCLSLNVGHGQEGPNPISSNITVTVSLVHADNGERSFCYESNTNYSSKLSLFACVLYEANAVLS